jgi:hypothetical protein
MFSIVRDMKASKHQIAIYKISEAMKVMGQIRKSGGTYDEIITQIFNIPDEILSIEQKWEIMKNTLHTLHIVISKEPERTEDLDDLDGMEILNRSNDRSCSNALCGKSHCRECGLCGHKRHDEHMCECARCGLKFVSASDGEIHNSETGCVN